MSSSFILSAVTFIYGLAACFYIASYVFERSFFISTARWIALTALAGNTAGIIIRWVESYSLGIGHAPFSNLYESLIFFAWAIAFIYIVFEFKYKASWAGAFILPIIFLTIAYASMSPNIDDRIQPLLPALKSNWLITHVITCFLGYAAFGVGFGLSIIYLIKIKNPDKKTGIISRFPNLEAIDELTYQMIIFGFLFLSAGIITGSVWANSAWGSYWSWDPKETWSLITWFIYATLLHAKKIKGWQGRRIAWLSLLGFTAVLFTYFGVNYLPGLHSYAT